MVVASWGVSLWSVDSVFVMKRKVGGDKSRSEEEDRKGVEKKREIDRGREDRRGGGGEDEL